MNMNKVFLFLSCLSLTGCTGMVGPYHLSKDSVNYNHAIQNSNDSQLLLNMVRLRYRDTPSFLQVGVISSAYDFKKSLSARFEYKNGGHSDFTRLFSPSLGMDFSEKPTTTYQPLRGEGFAKEMLAPISLHTISLLSSSGWKIDRIFRCCVQRMNRVLNAPSASGPTPFIAPDYEKFLELSAIFRELELINAIDVIAQKSKDVDFYLVVDKDRANPATLNRMWNLLELDLGTDIIHLIPSRLKKHKGNEVMIETRSPLGLMYFLSHGIKVPCSDEKSGLVTVTKNSQGGPFSWEHVLDGLMTVYWAPKGPICPAVAVDYRCRDFYIYDSDLDSKATFSMLMQLLSLQTGAKDISTVLTIPLNN